MPFAWLSALLNKTTLAAMGVGALVLFVAFQGMRLEQAKAAAVSAATRAEQAEALAAATKSALDTYVAESEALAKKQVAAGKVRAKTQAKVAAVLTSKTEGAADTARAAAADISAQWNDEANDE